MTTFILSDESLNSFKFWLRTSGIRLKQFKKNPIMYFMHIRPGGYENRNKEMLLPIGYWENIRVENNQLLADPVFDESDEFAMTIKKKVENKVLRMASLGAKPIKWSENKNDLKPGQTRATLIECEAFEASIVDRGSNNSALRMSDDDTPGEIILYNKDGEEIQLSEGGNIPVINLKKQNKMNENELNGLLKLADDANEIERYNAIKRVIGDNVTLKVDKENLTQQNEKLEQENVTLKADAKEQTNKKIETLVDVAVIAKKFPADQKEKWIKLATNDYDTAKELIDAMPGVVSLNNGLGETKKNDKYKDWTFADYQKKDPTTLALIRQHEPDKYNILFKEHFGKEPKQ